MSDTNGFSVLDMAQSYADENDVDVADLFKKHPVTGNIKNESNEVVDEKPVKAAVNPAKKKPWVPDASLTEGMADLQNAPVTYRADEIRVESEVKELKNITDDIALETSNSVKVAMMRQVENIEAAKRRFGILNMNTPEGPWQMKIATAASDPNTKAAAETLDIIFTDIVNNFPEFVRDWIDPNRNNQTQVKQSQHNKPQEFIDVKPEDVIVENQTVSTVTVVPNPDDKEQLKLIINKSQLPEITWSKDELEKIRKVRRVELNIVEHVELKYTNIQDIDDNAVDVVLSQYVRKVNDIIAVLPASNYRATFTGLTYTEVLDLSYSSELNNLDGERKKWSIAYDHLKNPSIGKFENFDDFLKKTSFIDIEFMMWKILCATTMDKEYVSITCNNDINGKPCGCVYDWIYSPRELLVSESVQQMVLDEMKKTGEADSPEDIEANYMESMLMKKNTVELPSSKFGVVFGHISAYDYLNYVYSEIDNLSKDKNLTQAQMASYLTLPVVKYFLVPFNNGIARIKGPNNLIRIINTLDEVDYQVIAELTRIMLEPYRFQFSLRNLCCPKCNKKSNIPIEDMTSMLFLLAQSLQNTEVTLKKA